MAAALEFACDPFEIVEFAVVYNVQLAVFACDRLGAGVEVDDVQTGVAESGAFVWRKPAILFVGTTWNKCFDRPAH